MTCWICSQHRLLTCLRCDFFFFIYLFFFFRSLLRRDASALPSASSRVVMSLSRRPAHPKTSLFTRVSVRRWNNRADAFPSWSVLSAAYAELLRVNPSRLLIWLSVCGCEWDWNWAVLVLWEKQQTFHTLTLIFGLLLDLKHSLKRKLSWKWSRCFFLHCFLYFYARFVCFRL